MRVIRKSNIFILVLLLLFSLPAVFPLFHSGFYTSDDGIWMIIRFSAFYEDLVNGQFPVRFLSRLNNGYGYPVANFLYPLFMYLGVPVHAFGFGFVDTIKIIIGFSMVGSAIFAYLWLSRLFDRPSSFIAALVYLYAPYHLYDAYKRGSVGEVLALAIAPFIFWQAERNSLFWLSIGIALLLLSHNTLALLFLLVFFVYAIAKTFLLRKWGILRFYTLSILFGFGLSAFFSIPAIFDLSYTVFFETQVSVWTKHFAGQGLIGVSLFAVFITTLLIFIIKTTVLKKRDMALPIFVIGILSVFFATPSSIFLWKIIPVSFVQFPFRFLSVSLLCASFLTAFILSVLPSKTRMLAGLFLIVLTVLSSAPFYPKEFQDYPDSFYSTNMDTTTVKNEYMPKWVKETPVSIYKQKIEVVKGGSIQNIISRGSKISFDIDLSTDSEIQINTIYFPGWRVFGNGR